MKKISIIILNWNGWEMTIKCLESLKDIKQDGFTAEVVVVDNGSTDGSDVDIKRLTKLRINGLFIKTILNKENLGFAEGNNVGIKYALENEADYICLLNNDTRADPDFLSELFKVAELSDEIGVVGGKIYFEKGFEFHKDRYSKEHLGEVIWYAGGLIDWKNVYASHQGVDEVDKGQYDQPAGKEAKTEYINGCLMLVKKEVIKKIGFFDPRYFLYFEDVDFSLRAKKAGFKLIFSSKAKIWHLNSGSSGSGSGLHDYFSTRNRMLFGLKYAPIYSKLALLKESISLLSRGRKWQKTGIKDFYLGKFGKGSWQ